MEFADEDVSASEEEEQPQTPDVDDADFHIDDAEDVLGSQEAVLHRDGIESNLIREFANQVPWSGAAAAATNGASSNAAVAAAIDTIGDLGDEIAARAAMLQQEASQLLAKATACRSAGATSAVRVLVKMMAAALASLPKSEFTAADDQGLAGFVSSLGLQPEDITLTVAPPVAVQLVGSWAIGTATSAAATAGSCGDMSAPVVVDVAVQLPTSCLHHKDHINYRYHAKRAMYLAALSSHLSNHPGFATAQRQLVPFQGDPNRPALQLWLDATNIRSLLLQQKRGKVAAAAVEGLQGVILQLLPVVGLDAFDITKLAPDRNNVRRVAASSSSSKKKAAQNQQQQGQEQQEMLLPTPAYNAGVLQDMLLLLGSKKLQQAAAAAGPRFADAAVLLKVWAVQQGLACHNVLPAASYVCCSGGAAASGQATPSAACSAAAAGAVSEAQADGLSGHVLTVLLLLAVQQVGAAAAAAMSAVQQFRCALQLLTDKQAWSKATLSLPLDPEVPVQLQKQQQPAAAAQPGSVSKDHSRLVQKLQQQLQRLPPPAAAADVFRKQFDVTLLDSSGHLNLAVSVSSTALQLAQQAAQRAVEILNGQNLEPSLVIAALFSADRGLAGVFDYWWTVELPNESGGSSATASSSSSSMPGDQHPMRMAEVQVEVLVRQALTSRAVLVKAIRRPPQFGNSWQQQQQQQAAPCKPQTASKGSSTTARRFSQSAEKIGAAAAAATTTTTTTVNGATGGRGRGIFSGAAGIPKRVTVGAVVDAAAALRVVDVGPAADDLAAAGKFRALWGDKSELRRFSDGKINEAVVWEGVPPGERHRIPDLAVQYILLRHLPPGTVVQSGSTALDPLLYPANSSALKGKSAASAAAAADVTWQEQQRQQQGQPGSTTGVTAAGAPSVAIAVFGSAASTDGAAATETAASRAADAALNQLGKQLRGLSDLALKVIGVQPLSSVTRHTCCFYPKPHPLAEGAGFGVYEGAGDDKVPRVLEPIEVMIQLEGSGRMPSEPASFAKMKAALGVQLAAALSAACGAKVTATEEALEVLWQGFAFKLLLYLDRDNPMLAALAGLPGSEAAIARITAAAAGAPVPRPVMLSRHHGLIAALEAAHAAYGPTVRLAKRWLGLQLLLESQVSEEAVELLVGAAFSGPSCRRAPASRINGFLRFLHLLASHPWSAAPLLVDPAREVKPAARRALLARFEALRAAGGCPGMFLATPYDLHSSTWTSHGHPGVPETHHLVTLARSALHQLSLLVVLGPDAPAVQQLARPSQGNGQLRRQGHKQMSLVGSAAAHGAQVHDQHQQHQQVKLEMAALAKAWRLSSGPAFLGGFDAWIVLRKEALPFPGRVDGPARQQLEALLAQQHKQQQQLALEAAAQTAGAQQQSEARGLQGSSKKKQKLLDQQQRQQQLGHGPAGAEGGGGASAALQHLLLQEAAGEGIWECEVPKESRAIIRNIPEQVLASKHVEKLQDELLVGFNPISHLLHLCNERYGALASFCADPVGCFPAIGLKWHPVAFLPSILNPGQAHGVMELGVTTLAGAGVARDNYANKAKKKKKRTAGMAVNDSQHHGLVVPNVPQVLAEVCEMGLGLIERVVLLT